LKTLARQGTNEKLIQGSVDRTGYLRFNLCKEGATKSVAAHRLVALAFIPNPENKRTVNHKNGNKTDNNVENLEWMTHSENHKHAYDELGRECYMKGRNGKLHHNAKAVKRVCKNTGTVLVYDTLTEAAASGNFCAGHISACCSGTRTSHKGYTWEFATPADFPNPEPRLQQLLDERI